MAHRDTHGLDQWIADQLAGLAEAELLRIKAKLDEIQAERPVIDRRTPTEREIDRQAAEHPSTS